MARFGATTSAGGRGPAAALALALLAASPVAAGPKVEVSGGYTGVAQSTDDDAVEAGVTGSADLFLTVSPRRGRIEVYVEGNTSLDDDGVSTLVPESNADAGTALDPDRSGRIQLSELKYALEFRRGATLTVGLVDPTAYLDTTRINNDENMQFLGASFVNNPAIEFPDYTLGAVYEHPGASRRPDLRVLVASSHGISDNPSLSYSQVLDVDADDKGVFMGAEAGWTGTGRLFKTGGWVHTASHLSLDGRRNDDRNFGVYGALGRSRGRAAGNLRVGFANPDVSLGSAFAAASFQFDWGRRVLGLGLAHAWLSPESTEAGLDDSSQVEAYLRIEVVPNLYLTPSLQYVVNSGFDASETVHDSRIVVFGLRLHQTF